MGVDIKLIGPLNTEEYQNGLLLKQILEKHLTKNTVGKISIVCNVQLFGQTPQDVDLVLFGSLNKAEFKIKTNTFQNRKSYKYRKVFLDSFFFCIETKAHTNKNIEMVGTNLVVKYSRNKKHDATSQSEGQKYSLHNYLTNLMPHMKIWVSNFIWLNNIEKPALEELVGVHPNNILHRDFSLNELFSKACLQSPPRKAQSNNCYFSAIYYKNCKDQFPGYEELYNLFSAPKQSPGALTRKNIERIVGSEIVIDASLKNKLGKHLIMVVGRAGTGKTVKMLKLGCDLAREQEKRCLFLTYNKALVNDIQRTLYFADIPMDFDQACLSVMTIHGFVKKLGIAFGIIEKDDYQIKKHLLLCAEIAQYIDLEVITQDDILSMMKNRQELACWDYVFVDEAQDFEGEEKRLLFKFFGYNKLIIADGLDQFVRGFERLNWGKNIYVSKTKENRCLRQERNLANFVNSYASQIELDWKVDILPELIGGKIYISKDLTPFNTFNKVREECYRQGNKAFELLFLTPPTFVKKLSGGGREFKLMKKFKDNGFNLWDGTSRDIRTSAPLKLDQHRLLQYDSCRGLEGWSVVCLGFDDFINYKTKHFYKSHLYENKQTSIVAMDTEEMCKQYVGLWSLIPLTRAIDSIIITLSNPNSQIAEVLSECSNKDYVEFI